jgi:hypothetical protein
MMPLRRASALVMLCKHTVEVTGNIVTKRWAATDGSSQGTSTTRYVCLPDTVDPRGTKTR